MATFAKETTVPVERSKAEIETVLARYGASAFASGWDQRQATIAFVVRKLRVRFVLTLPDPTESRFHMNGRSTYRRVSADSARARWEQACRQRWRALLLVVRAKLEAVEAGISTFEQEFLAHIVLPDGQSVGDWIVPQIEEVYATGRMPALLPAGQS